MVIINITYKYESSRSPSYISLLACALRDSQIWLECADCTQNLYSVYTVQVYTAHLYSEFAKIEVSWKYCN